MKPEGSLPCRQKPAYFPTLSQMKQVHVQPNDAFKIYFNIILQSTPGSSERSISLRCLHQNGVRNNLLLLKNSLFELGRS